MDRLIAWSQNFGDQVLWPNGMALAADEQQTLVHERSCSLSWFTARLFQLGSFPARIVLSCPLQYCIETFEGGTTSLLLMLIPSLLVMGVPWECSHICWLPFSFFMINSCVLKIFPSFPILLMLPCWRQCHVVLCMFSYCSHPAWRHLRITDESAQSRRLMVVTLWLMPIWQNGYSIPSTLNHNFPYWHTHKFHIFCVYHHAPSYSMPILAFPCELAMDVIV